MFDIRAKESIIAEALKSYLGCEVVMANQATPAPAYPYLSYTITNPLVSNNGTYGTYEDGTKRKEYQQRWSFTSQSDDDTESKVIALKAHMFFSETGVITLLDEGISPQIVGDVTVRDNLLSIGYEYRNGFDVTFAFVSEIAPDPATEGIESIAIGNMQIDVQDEETLIEQLTRERDVLLAELENLNLRIDEANTRLQNRIEGGE